MSLWTVKALFTVIGTALFSACGGAVDAPLTVTQRFVVELAPDQEPKQLESVARDVIDARIAIEPLFPTAQATDDPYGLSRMYRVSTDSEAALASPWDYAYRLRDRGRFVNVEPDLETTLADAQETGAVSACMGDQGIPAPIDPSWSLRDIRAPEAWAIPPGASGKAQGEGVRICHPDTGWTHHVDLDQSNLDLTAARNILDGNEDALDPLGYSGNPGHGTATGSVIVSGGGVGTTSGTTPPGLITGVAPKATLVPIRTIKSVVQVLDSDVARAVRHAADARCDVVSMSLGGRAFFGLERAIKDAVRRDVIVIAAAGNCVGFVVAPASYDESIAVAATNAERKPWKGSSHGRSIEIAAPGEDVHNAEAASGSGNHAKTKTGNGTSFAVANIAGTAADWIAFHGRAAIDKAQGDRTRRDLFVTLIQASATRPPDWQSHKYGAGIVNVAALLQTPLEMATAAAIPAPANDVVSLLSRQFDRDPTQIRAAVARLLQRGDSAAADLEPTLARYGAEIQYIATRDPQAFLALLDAPPGDTAAAAASRQNAVDRFAARASQTLKSSSSARTR